MLSRRLTRLLSRDIQPFPNRYTLNKTIDPRIKRSFCKKKDPNEFKKIDIPSEFEQEIQNSYSFKIMERYKKMRSQENKTGAVGEIFKLFLLFRKYIFPNRTRDPYFFKIITKSYFFLIFSKLTTSLMPLCMKTGINLVSQPSFNLYHCIAVFSMYPFLNLISSYLEGRRILQNSKVTQSAIAKISLEAYRKLLQLDWIAHHKGLSAELFNLEKVRKSIERNLNLLNSIMIPMVCEMLISSIMICYYCGPLYLLNLLGSMYLYIRFSIIHSVKRKSFITRQHELDKQSNFVISGDLSILFDVKFWVGLILFKYIFLKRHGIL